MRKLRLNLGILCFLFVSVHWGEAQASLYVTVAGAQVKKAKLAVGQIRALGTPRASLAQELETQIKGDFEWMNVFDLVPSSQFETLDQSSSSAVNFEAWKHLQIAFYLQLAYRVAGADAVMEAHYYDIFGQKKIFSKTYRYSALKPARLVHALSEDMLQVMTGEHGLFLSRILMSCETPLTGKPRLEYPREIFIMDADGRNVKQLTFDRTLSLSPNWNPNGRAIVYTQFLMQGRKKIMGLRTHDLETGQRVTLWAHDGVNSGAAYAPDGSRIAATLSFTGRPTLYFLDPTGRKQPESFSEHLRWKKLSGEGFQPNYIDLLLDVEPSWSPNMLDIAFSSARTGHPMIYVAHLPSMTATQLTVVGLYNASPSWSPRYNRLAFAAQHNREGNFDLYLIDPDGNNLDRLTNGDRKSGVRGINNKNPSWGPTGRHLVFASDEGGSYAIYGMTSDGSQRRRISPPGKICETPSWGPAEP